MIHPIHALEGKERAIVGGKALSLGVLATAGFDVPGGFVLTTAALRLFLQDTGLAGELLRLESALEAGGLPHADELARFREQLRTAATPGQLLADIAAHYESVFEGGRAVAVRSSGTREDLEAASFAGQYETVLNVRGLDELEVAVKHCWASLWEPRVLEYAKHRGGGAAGLEMSVIVQEMIQADVSGVMFTVNPLTGREGEVLIEAVFGLGEALVSGRTNADRYVIDARTGDVIEREISMKALRITSAERGTVEEQVDTEAASLPTLDEERLRALAERAAEIQEHYGRPMDVEWSFAGDRLAILQARPVTELAFSPELGEWTTADLRDGGVSSDVCTPFMWSLYESALEISMPSYFKMLKLVPQDDVDKWSTSFFCRPYWNLGKVKNALMALPGFDETSFYKDLGVDFDDEAGGRSTPVTFGGIVRALPTLMALKRSYREQLRTNAEYVAAFEERKAPFDVSQEALRAMSREEFGGALHVLVEELYRETETRYFTTIYNTSNSKTDLNGVLGKVSAACGGELGQLDLVGGLKDLSHLRPMKDLHRVAGELVARGESVSDEVVRAFAERWRHHGKKELEIRAPRWSEDLPFVRQMLERAVDNYSAEDSPEKLEEEQHERYLAARRKAMRAIRWRPLLRRSFGKKLDQMRAYAWWREEMREHSTYLYYLVRLWAREAARRMVAEGILEELEDVWMLSFQQFLAAFDGARAPEQVRADVKAGRRQLASFRNFDNPNEIGSHFRYDSAAVEFSADALRGTPCSPGRVTGRARVVRDLDEADKLEPSDILVTSFTDPGWTPLFSLLGAVVTETGGVLSHAAVIAREYGIPAVLAVPGATRVIEDGATITVDGVAGVIEVHEVED